MKDRIDKILKEYGLTSARFADIIGVQRSSISHIMSGRNKPGFDFISKILLKYPEIDADWLITGRGSIKKHVTNQNKGTNQLTEPDLFDQVPIKQAEIADITKQIATENNIKIQSATNEKELTDNSTSTQITNVNYIKSILFIYDDNTFEVINKK